MTLRAEIRGVLTAGPRNAEQIAELCGLTVKQASQNLSALKGEGKVKSVGTIEGKVSYAIANWPEKKSGDKAAPPPRRARGKRGKASRARTAATPAPAPSVNGNGAEEFAITDTGVLAIKQGDTAIQIHPESFTRLRTFIERAEAIFNPTE